MQAIVGQVADRVGGAPGKRGYGGVIEVDQVVADGELIGVFLPKRRGHRRFFYISETHSSYDTSIMAIWSRGLVLSLSPS